MKFNMQDMMQKVQQMQQEAEKIKNEVTNREVTADSGGGMVTVTMTGGHELRSIKISKELINPDDPEMLEDLIVAAVNKASKEADEMVAQEMNKITGMMPNIPGLNLNM
ncbi:MAG: YbaB/EbfC family nucleoid-associated protein [Bacteroidota bacterium]